jgi:DNA-binding IclR family transcriptional regulator
MCYAAFEMREDDMDLDVNDDAAQKHRVPVIDKMMEILVHLERKPGSSISDLVTSLVVPRTTIYRVLNTLQLHDMVRRDAEGSYFLGRRLLSLAAHVGPGSTDLDLISLAQPHLDRLANMLGEGVKLSIIDDSGILVLAAVQGRKEYALSVAPGQRMPTHAGAASKVLLAHLPPEQLHLWLARPLAAFSSKTITDPKRLEAELTRIRKQGWAQDRGENAPSIQAFAAPVFDGDGTVVAAISVPFLAGTSVDRMTEIRVAVVEAARTMTESMPRSSKI